jgi:hypothetical protein
MIERKIIIGIQAKEQVFYSAIITGIKTRTYDVQLSNGFLKKNLINSSGIPFNIGDHVSVLYSVINKTYIIVGNGKKMNKPSSMETVSV